MAFGSKYYACILEGYQNRQPKPGTTEVTTVYTFQFQIAYQSILLGSKRKWRKKRLKNENNKWQDHHAKSQPLKIFSGWIIAFDDSSTRLFCVFPHFSLFPHFRCNLLVQFRPSSLSWSIVDYHIQDKNKSGFSCCPL